MKKKSIALSLAITTLAIGFNMNSIFAKSVSELPLTNTMTYTFNTYEEKQENGEATIEVLKLDGLSNKDFETKLNDKFMDEAQAAYNEFTTTQKENEGTEGVFSIGLDYQIKTDTSTVLSIEALKYTIMASSNQDVQYYNIDKAKQEIITLPSLFKDSSYINKISDYIKGEMRRQMKENENISYFIDTEMEGNNFEKIKADQSFYINNKGQLVISFGKYEAAPGYMGIVEFVIPTEQIQDILNNNDLVW